MLRHDATNAYAPVDHRVCTLIIDGTTDVLIDAHMKPEFQQRRWRLFTARGTVYVRSGNTYAHQLVIGRPIMRSHQIVYRNGNRFDLTRANLAVVAKAAAELYGQQVQRRTNKTGVLGVYVSRGGFLASAMINGERVSVWRRTLAEAAAWRRHTIGFAYSYGGAEE